MNTCEQCGSDAVDARGICRVCGWQAQTDRYGALDDSPSLGETRAADIPPGGYGSPNAPSQPTRSSRMNPYPTEARSTVMGGVTSGGRFCGTCGARIESGMAFCGQCGTPVSGSNATGLSFGASELHQSGQEQYRVGGWSDDNGNDLTEQMPGAGAPAYNGFGRTGVGPGLPYGGTPFHPAGYSPSRPGGASRSSQATRLIIGVICLVASIVSASTAIILFITMK